MLGPYEFGVVPFAKTTTMPHKTLSYIAHPLGGDIKANIAKVQRIIRFINHSEPDTIPFCPWLADATSLDDDRLVDRVRGLSNALYCLEHCSVEELRLYGDKLTNGMEKEVEVALDLGIPITTHSVALLNKLFSLHPEENFYLDETITPPTA